MQSIRQELQMDLPPMLQYVAPKRGLGPMRREHVLMPPQGASTIDPVSAGHLLRFRLPSSAYLDPSRTQLRFQIKASAAARFDSLGAPGVIQRLRILIQGQVAEDVQEYGKLSKILQLTNSDNFSRTVGGIMDGTTDSYQNLNDAAVGGATAPVAAMHQEMLAFGDKVTTSYVNYCISFNSGLLGATANDYWPLWALQDVEIEITLADPKRFLLISSDVETALENIADTAITTQTYSLNDCKLAIDIVHLPDQLTAGLQERLRAGNTIKLAFGTYTHTSGAITSSDFTFNVPLSLSDVSHVWVVKQNNVADVSNFNFSGYQFSTAQLQIGSVLVPNTEIKSTTEALCHFVTAAGRLHNRANVPQITEKGWTVPHAKGAYATKHQEQFILGFDLRKYFGARTLTGMPVESNMTILQTWSGTPVSQTLHAFVGHTRVLVVSAEGVAILR